MTPEEFEQLKVLLSKFFQERLGAMKGSCYCIVPTCNNAKCPMWWQYFLLSDKIDTLKDIKWV